MSVRRVVWLVPVIYSFFLITCKHWHIRTKSHAHSSVLATIAKELKEIIPLKTKHQDYEWQSDSVWTSGPVAILAFLNLGRHLVFSKCHDRVRPRQAHVPALHVGRRPKRELLICSLDRPDTRLSTMGIFLSACVWAICVLPRPSFLPWDVVGGNPASGVPLLLWGLLPSAHS